MSGPGQEDGAEKSFEPSPKKLEDARRRGEFARSADLNATAALAGLALALVFAGEYTVRRTGTALMTWLEEAPLTTDADPAALERGALALMLELFLGLAPLFGLPILAVAASVAAQRAFVFAPDKLKPKLSRISPIEVAKNKYGRSGLFEFAKSAVKLILISATVALFLLARRDELVGSLRAEPAQIGLLMGQLLLAFLGVVILINLGIAAADYFWQVQEHRRRHMMTRKELTDELKQTEGDPHMKQTRRQRGQEIATNRMLADVPGADVVMVNPEHYAVALRWERDAGTVPVCVAKGVDEIAARIREAAAAAGVPIHRDPPAARALHATVEIGEEIRPEHYEAVAAAIRFAETVRAAARARGR